MRFEDLYVRWTNKRLTQQEAASLLGVCNRTFRSWAGRYEEQGAMGLADGRLGKKANNAALAVEVAQMLTLFETQYRNYTVSHFKVDANFKTHMAQLGLDEQKIAVHDRDCALRCEMVTRDRIAAVLDIMLIIGFFGVLSTLMFYPIEPSAKSVIDIMLGSLGTPWISVITYYLSVHMVHK